MRPFAQGQRHGLRPILASVMFLDEAIERTQEIA
jgi:hypothetical protein